MPAPDKPAKSIGRFSIGFNVLVQVLLGLFLFGVVNYLSWRTYKRWDLTAQQAHTLSPATIGYLEAMEKPAKLTVLFTRGTQLSNNVYDLVDEYKRHAGNKLEVEYIDPVRQPNDLEDLKARYNFDFSNRKDGIIVEVEGGDKKPRTKFVLEDKFAIINAENRRLVAYTGETALTSALLAVSEDKKPVIKIVMGKGGFAKGANDRTAADFLSDFARQQNAAIEPLYMDDPKAELTGADVIVFLNIGSDLTDDEAARLREYWESKRGALLIMLNPEKETPRLRAFLKEYGVLVQNDRVMSVTYPPRGPQIDWTVNGTFIPSSVVTKALREFTSEFSGKTQSLVLDTLRSDDLKGRGIHIEPLMQAAEHFWGETLYYEDTPKLDPGSDIVAPLTAVKVEMGAVNDAALRIDSSRMVVVGNATLLDPPVAKVHHDFAWSSLNWMLNRDEMVGITPKEKQYYQLDIDDSKSRRVFQIVVLALPSSVIFFGLFVWSMRRA
jgi:hypothetical protein